jgi:hypothetical protein
MKDRVATMTKRNISVTIIWDTDIAQRFKTKIMAVAVKIQL